MADQGLHGDPKAVPPLPDAQLSWSAQGDLDNFVGDFDAVDLFGEGPEDMVMDEDFTTDNIQEATAQAHEGNNGELDTPPDFGLGLPEPALSTTENHGEDPFPFLNQPFTGATHASSVTTGAHETPEGQAWGQPSNQDSSYPSPSTWVPSSNLANSGGSQTGTGLHPDLIDPSLGNTLSSDKMCVDVGDNQDLGAFDFKLDHAPTSTFNDNSQYNTTEGLGLGLYDASLGGNGINPSDLGSLLPPADIQRTTSAPANHDQPYSPPAFSFSSKPPTRIGTPSYPSPTITGARHGNGSQDLQAPTSVPEAFPAPPSFQKAAETRGVRIPRLRRQQVNLDVSKYYVQQLSSPPPFSDKFRYNKDGEWKGELSFSRDDLFHYMHERVRANLPLTIWVQNLPAQCNTRGGRDPRTRKCRWENCPAAGRTILKGFWRVAFDERPGQTGKTIDPFMNAGYMHLWCFEKCFDLIELISQFKNIKPDDRRFDVEEHNPMSLVRDHPDMYAAFEGWVSTQYDQWKDWFKKSQQSRLTGGAPAKDRRQQEKGDHLWYVLTKKHLDSESRTRQETRNKRGGVSIDVHVGDLDMYVHLTEERKAKKKIDDEKLRLYRQKRRLSSIAAKGSGEAAAATAAASPVVTGAGPPPKRFRVDDGDHGYTAQPEHDLRRSKRLSSRDDGNVGDASAPENRTKFEADLAASRRELELRGRKVSLAPNFPFPYAYHRHSVPSRNLHFSSG